MNTLQLINKSCQVQDEYFLVLHFWPFKKNSLSNTRREILTHYFGLDGVPKKTIKEIAQQRQVSRQSVWESLKKGIKYVISTPPRFPIAYLQKQHIKDLILLGEFYGFNIPMKISVTELKKSLIGLYPHVNLLTLDNLLFLAQRHKIPVPQKPSKYRLINLLNK